MLQLCDFFAIFPGQGSQKVGMGKTLSDNFSTARELFSVADDSLGFYLSKLCFEGPSEELTLTMNAQPAILTVSWIYYILAKENGLSEPVSAAGHSLGEYTALMSSGAISFRDAVLLVHKRGRYMQTAVPVGKGRMIAVLGKEVAEIEATVSKVISGVAEIANINAPGQIVMSGDVDGINDFVQALGKAKIIELPVSAPFHSSLMRSAAEKLKLDIESLNFKDPTFPVFSNYSATPLYKAEDIKQALVLQVCGKVRWVECMQNGIEQFNPSEFVEFGEGNTLTGLMKRINPEQKTRNINSVESLVTLRNTGLP